MKTSVLQRLKRSFQILLPGNSRYHRFIILSSARSGSTLLHTYLNSSFNIHSLGEQPWRDLEKGTRRDYFKAYPRFIQAIGFKVFYQFSREAPYDELYQILKKDKKIRVIHLVRENMLEQYISEMLAWEKRSWTFSKGATVQDTITLDLHGFDFFLNKQEEQQAQSLDDFKEQQLITVSYESLMSEPQVVLAKVQAFLEVPQRQLFSVLKKQNTQPLVERLENVDEVKVKYPQYFS